MRRAGATTARRRDRVATRTARSGGTGPRLFGGLLGTLLCLAALLVALPVGAQPRLDTSVSASTVEAGEPFELELQAVVTEGDSPSGATLSLPAGIDIVRGPSVGSRREMSFVNGSFETRKGITATWTLVANKPGSYAIGPASVTWNGSRFTGKKVQVSVVPAGSRPRRPARRRRLPFDDPFDFDPFDLLRGNDRHLPDPRDTMPLAPPDDYVVDKAPDPVAFLRATPQPSRVVVGQQVTLRVYAYGARGPFDEVNTSEASRAKFLSHVIVENSYREQRYPVLIGGVRYSAVKVREIALFPLEAGNLEIGPMRMGFRGHGYPASAAHRGLVRHSNPLTVRVEEPPIAGRPAGYRLGDVGRFTLSATVEPRRVEQGGAVSVVLTIDGTGYPPDTVRLPEQSGVEWMKPEVSEQLRQNGSRLGGTRRLAYVVQVERPGSVDLGVATLPYYDPDLGRYAVARAGLGKIEVEPSSASVAAAPSASSAPAQPEVRLSDLATPRAQMRPLPRADARLADSLAFWLLLVTGPLGVLGITGVLRLGRSVAARSRSRDRSAQSQAKLAMGEARAAAKAGDIAAMTSALERALYASVEGTTGVKGRGLLRERLAGALVEAGLTSELADEVVETLGACEAMRFAAESSDPTALVERTASLVSRVGGRA